MKGTVLLWCGCLLAITLSILHFVWVASTAERLLLLTLLIVAGLFALRGRR